MTLKRLKAGATTHLKNMGFWMDSYESVETLDGLVGVVAGDYTDLDEYPHLAFHPFNLDLEIGISPDFIEDA